TPARDLGQFAIGKADPTIWSSLLFRGRDVQRRLVRLSEPSAIFGRQIQPDLIEFGGSKFAIKNDELGDISVPVFVEGAGSLASHDVTTSEVASGQRGGAEGNVRGVLIQGNGRGPAYCGENEEVRRVTNNSHAGLTLVGAPKVIREPHAHRIQGRGAQEHG